MFDGINVRWEVTNNGNSPITISSISLNWPVQNGALIRIGNYPTIFQENRNPPSTLIDSNWIGQDNKRTIDPGQTTTLEFVFANSAITIPSLYNIRVNFGSCSVQFPAASLSGCNILGPDTVCEVENVWHNASLVEVPPYIYTYKWKVDDITVGMGKDIKIIWRPYSSGYHILSLNITQTWGVTTFWSERSKQVHVVKKPIVKITVTRS
jgi:hypothetical protein